MAELEHTEKTEHSAQMRLRNGISQGEKTISAKSNQV